MFAIETKNLRKSYNNFWALNGIDLKIPKNQLVSILGPNGAGKTTLLEIIEGFQEPTEGEVKILGYSLKEKNKFAQKIGICLQETRFIDKLTVYETLSLFANLYSVKKNRIEEVLELLELNQKRNTYTQNLSGGQRQRLALGIALLHKPEIIFLDEPTTGLDPEIRMHIWKILKDLKNTNTTIILTTHYMEEAEFLSDYIYLMNRGFIVAEGTLKDLFKQFQKNYFVEFTISKKNNIYKIEKILRDKEIKILSSDRIQIKIPIESKKNFISTIQKFLTLFEKNNVLIKEIDIHKPNLNDLFITLTGNELNKDEFDKANL